MLDNHTYYHYVFGIVNATIVIMSFLLFDRTESIDTVSAIVTYIFDKIITPLDNTM